MKPTILTPVATALDRIADLYKEGHTDCDGMIRFDLLPPDQAKFPIEWFRAVARLIHVANQSLVSPMDIRLNGDPKPQEKIVSCHYDKLICTLPAEQKDRVESWKINIFAGAALLLEGIKNGWEIKTKDGQFWYRHEISQCEKNDVQPLIFMADAAPRLYYDKLKYLVIVSNPITHVLDVSEDVIDQFLAPAGLTLTDLFACGPFPERPTPVGMLKDIHL